MVGLYCCALLSVFKICCKSALRRFFVEAWQVVSCALHHLNHLVETHAVASVGEVCIRVGVECTGGGEGVALDTRNLHKAAHGVARQSEVVFESISAAYSICDSVPPNSWQAAAAAIAHATPTSP